MNAVDDPREGLLAARLRLDAYDVDEVTAQQYAYVVVGARGRTPHRVHVELAKDGKLFIDRSIVVDHHYRLKV